MFSSSPHPELVAAAQSSTASNFGLIGGGVFGLIALAVAVYLWYLGRTTTFAAIAWCIVGTLGGAIAIGAGGIGEAIGAAISSIGN